MGCRGRAATLQDLRASGICLRRCRSCASWIACRVSSGAALDLRDRVRDVPDFPKPGIVIQGPDAAVADAVYFRETIDRLAELRDPAAGPSIRREAAAYLRRRAGPTGSAAASCGPQPGKLPWDPSRRPNLE